METFGSRNAMNSDCYNFCGAPIGACEHCEAIPPEVIRRVKEYKEVNGRNWKAKLRALWSSGNDVDSPLLRQARNLIGPSGLDRIKV